MLRGKAWRRLHPRVWVHADHVMSHLDSISAARLAMPDAACLSHVSRLQYLGLDWGPHLPIHFTIPRDHHIALPDIFLHRTEVLPPVDDVGVVPAAAFIQYCADAELLDAVVVGDWLLHRHHATRADIAELAALHDWRPGARQAASVLHRLDGAARSPKESQVRAIMRSAGLPEPAVNAAVHHGSDQIAIVDLLLGEWRLALEYEGRQHALDTRQFQVDIVRYARLREAGYEYVQITQPMLNSPRALVTHIHQVLVRRGYGGPPPRFGRAWHALFEPIAVRPRLRAVS